MQDAIPGRYRDDPNIIFFDPQETGDAESSLDSSSLGILRAINQRICGMFRDLGQLLHYVFEETKTMFPCNRLGLSFLSEDDQRVTAYVAVADYPTILLGKGYSEDIQGSSLEYILKSGKSRVIQDLAAYADRFPDSRSTRVLLKEVIRSSLTCPLKIDDHIVGLFFRSSTVTDAYTPKHVTAHLAIAERLSQAVEKAYRIERLTEANHHFKEMLGFVSHEIKNPLATTIMESKMILENYLGEMDPRIRTRIERIAKRSDNLLTMVRDYLDLSRLEAGDLEIRVRQRIDLQEDVVKPVIENLQAAAEEKNMSLRINTLQESMFVDGDPDMLRIAMSNLLSNAIKYGNNDSLISCDLESRNNLVILSVRNEGPGFAADQIPNLFRKFSRLQTPELIRRKGTGLGLYITWKIVRLHSGRIRAESVEGSWARFTIELPEAGPQ